MDQPPATQSASNLSDTATASTPKYPWGRNDLARFLSQLPQLSGARNLMQKLDTVTQQISLHVMTHCPEYVEEVGEAGMHACGRDNYLTLLRTAQLLSGPQSRPQEALLWWWEASVGGYLVHRARNALEANLQGMYQSLDSHLHRTEVKPMVDLISQMYQEALGVQLKVHSAIQLQTEHLALEGPHWQAVFAPSTQINDEPTAALDWFSAVEPSGEQLPMPMQFTQNLPQAIQHALQGVMQVKTQKILWTFIDANLQYGDEEAAWSKAQTLIERSLRAQSCALLLNEWRGLLVRLPQWMTPAASAYWTDTLLRGLDIIAQVSLGRTLQTEHKRVAAEIAVHLMQQRVVRQYSPRDNAEQKCKRDLGLFLAEMGQILVQNPPSLAALNISRYLVQNIAPFVSYPARVWRIVWLKLQESLWPHLHPQEQNQLLLWVAQLQDLCADLHATRPLGEAVFHQAAPVFGDPNIAEQDWRNLLGGLLAAALTSAQAPYPSALLAQRLLLSSPAFRAPATLRPAKRSASSAQVMDANQWQIIHTALTESFAELLPVPLLERLQEVQANISHGLLRLSMCESLAGSTVRLRFYLALPSLPYLAHSWHIHLWASSSRKFLLNPQDRLLAELNRWTLPDAQTLRASFEMYASLATGNTTRLLSTTTAEAGKADQASETVQISLADEYALNFRCLALYGQTPQLPAVLYANWLFLEANIQPQQLMNDWFSRLPNSHVLSDTATQALAFLPKFAVARRLLNPDKDLSSELFSVLQVNPCIDLAFVLRQIGVSLTGLLPHLDLAHWYQNNVAVFISLRTRQRNAKLWSPLVQHLAKGWSPAEQKCLVEAVKNLARPLPKTRAAQMPRLSVRHFKLQGAVWTQVFQTATTSPMPQALQQVLPICSTQLSAAVYQGLQTFCQPWEMAGDIETVWERLQQHWQTQLRQQTTAALYQDWQAALPILAQHLSPMQQAYWLHTLQKGLNLLAQTGLGLRLQQRADDIANRVAQRLAQAPQGFTDYGLVDPIMAAAKCRRDQALLLQTVGELLSQQVPSLAALNIGRYLIQNIVPFVNYNVGVWQLLWLVWQDASLELLDPIEQQALRQWCEQLNGLSQHFPTLYALEPELFHTFNTLPDTAQQAHSDLLGGLLCAAATPDAAPIAGSYVLQRLVLCSPLFAHHSAASWQQVQAELAQTLAALEPSELHHSLQQRYKQVFDLLFKLPRLQEWQNCPSTNPAEQHAATNAGQISADEIEALLLSAAPTAELTWNLSQYASAHLSTSAILVQQSNGWNGVQLQQVQQLAQNYQIIHQFNYHQPLGTGKWYQRNQPNSLPAAAVPLLQTLLCQLSLHRQLCPSVSAQTIRLHLSQTWQTMLALQIGINKNNLLNFAQMWQQQHTTQPMLAQLGELITQHLPAVTAGHKLLHGNFTKPLAKLTTVARCAADAHYTLKHMGAVLCGEPQSSAFEVWYAQHIGRFLKPATRQMELQFYNKWLKACADIFDAEEQAAITPLLTALQQSLMTEAAPTQIEWTVSR